MHVFLVLMSERKFHVDITLIFFCNIATSSKFSLSGFIIWFFLARKSGLNGIRARKQRKCTNFLDTFLPVVLDRERI